MDMWKRRAATVLIALLMAGCGTSRQGGHAPAQAPEPEQGRTAPAPAAGAAAPIQPQAMPEAHLTEKEAALPLWGEPGVGVYRPEKWTLSYSFEPVEILGTLMQAFETPDGTIYAALQEGAVYQFGYQSRGNAWTPLEKPQLLYRLPLRPGDAWQLIVKGDSERHRVEGFESVKTPDGTRNTVRISVDDLAGKRKRREWWAPGYGLVRTESGDGQVAFAAAMSRTSPRRAPAVGQPAPAVKALLWSDAQEFRVTSLDGKTEYLSVRDSEWESSYEWQPVGDTDLLLHTSAPGPYGVRTYDLLALAPGAARMSPVDFVRQDGSRRQHEGAVLTIWDPSGQATFYDFTGYPAWEFTYRFESQPREMRAVPDLTRRMTARTAEGLVKRMVSTPPLAQADFLSMWADPGLGQQYLDALKRQESVQQVDMDPSGQYHAVSEHPARFEARYGLWTRFTIEPVANEFKIVAWEWAK